MLKQRSIFICILLSMVTFGIYSLFWVVSLANDFAHKNNKPSEGGKVILFTILTLGIYFLVWSYKMGNNIEEAGGKNEGAVYLVLNIFGLSVVALALMQNQENTIALKEIGIENR